MVRAELSDIRSYDCTDDVVTLDCTVSFDHDVEIDKYELPTRAISVRIEFFSPSTFRFELDTTPTGANDARREGIEFHDEAIQAGISPSVSESDGVLSVTTTELELRIGLDEWSFEVLTSSGTSLLKEQRTDITAKGESRTDPLGFTSEVVNRWPFRTTETGGSFELFPDEHIYGLGEKFTDLDKRGQTIESWITQPNGAETERSYKNVPFYLSSRGYGLLVDTTQRTTFDFGRTSTVSKDISVEDDSFAFVFFHGPSFKDILSQYTALTGRPGSVPKWSLGVWMSRLGYQNRAELESVTDEIRTRGFPCDVVHLDPPWLRPGHLCDLVWDRESFPDPDGMIEALHEDGFKLCLWEYPYLLTETEAFHEAAEKGYLITDPRGEPYLLTRLSWAADHGGIVDFTNPDARQWWKDKHRPLVEMGVDVFKTDFGEYLPEDAIMADGRSGKAVRNEHTNLYTRTVHEAMAEAGSEPLLWARPGWAGGQQYPVHWGGDPNSTFGSMASSLRGGLSLACSGYAFWSCDIGGFHGEPSPELYVRWAQFGLLGMSHARFHGTTPREPWEYGEEAAEIVQRYALERYRLLPYLHSLSVEATESGLPVMRPLVLEFQDDMAVYDNQTQLMLGDALLVAPVLSSTNSLTLYLPEGQWVDYWTDERYEGGQTITVETPLDTMPVFQRAGTTIPTREPTQWIDDTPAEEVTLRTVLEGGFIDYETTTYELEANGTDVQLFSDEATGTIAVDVDGDHTRFELIVRAVETPPLSIEVNGQTLTKVDEAPVHGEWTYADGTVVAKL